MADVSPPNAIALPDEWYISLGLQVKLWGTPTLAHIMESSAEDRKKLRLTTKGDHNKEYAHTWGLPDFRSAREMVGLSLREVQEEYMFADGALECVEMGWHIPCIHVIEAIADDWHWPLAAFFRGPETWHPMTYLSRKWRFCNWVDDLNG
jgi:hypothetical protein